MKPVKERKDPQSEKNVNKTQIKAVLEIDFHNIENVSFLFETFS